MNYKHYLEIASECAKNASYSGASRVKLGCVAVYHGSVLAKGCNMDKTHTQQEKYRHLRYDPKKLKTYCPSKCHAETSVLTKIKYLDIDFSKVVLVIAREHRNGDSAIARPCAACMAAIKELGIRTIVYSTEEGYAVEYLNNF